MLKGLAAQRLVALFVAGGLLFNYPLLTMWDRDATLLGMPLFPTALFVGWALMIVLVAWITEGAKD